MKKTTYTSSLVAAGLLSLSAAGHAAINYSNDFESYDASDVVTPLGDDGWLVGANVFDSTGINYIYGYFAFPAANSGAAFSGVAVGEGGVNQGAQQLNTFSDYANANHTDGSGFVIEANVFRDVGIIDGSDIGTTATFTFDAKLGNLESPTTSAAFIKVIKTSDTSFATLASVFIDTHTIGSPDWAEDLSLSLDLNNAAFAGETLQIGFLNRASNGDDSGVFYDNINVSNAAVPVPAAAWLFGSALLGLSAARRKNS